MSAAHRVAVLVLPGVLPLEFGIAAQVFGADSHYQLDVCAPSASRRMRGDGFAITAPSGLAALADADTVIVPGYDDIDRDLPRGALAALRDAHGRGTRLVSICSGAFALAAAGVLDGRPATTHWQQAGRLQAEYPSIRVVPNRLFVDDGDVLTSAGVTAGVDLCLHLIRRDHGSAAANDRARALVAPPQRAGGQAQYVERLRPTSRGTSLADMRDHVLAQLDRTWDVDTMAELARLSRRTLVRRFREETGTSPMAWLTSARLDRARELLESTDEPVERIARLAGLGPPVTMRATFQRHLRTSPRAYRELFRHRGDG